MALNIDLIELLQAFAAAKVRHLLIGGHALAIHGVWTSRTWGTLLSGSTSQDLVDIATLEARRQG